MSSLKLSTVDALGIPVFPGKLSTEKRANNVWKQILEEFKPPIINSKIASELDAFVQRRKKEGGAKTDF